MSVDNTNLYEMLFPDHEDDDLDNSDDIGRLRIKEIFDNADTKDICKELDLAAYNQSFQDNDHSSLSVMHFNIRNLITNKDELVATISMMKRKPDIIALSETWLAKADDSNVVILGYKCYNIIRKTPHGGVSLLVSDNLESCLIEKFSYISPEIEICTVSVKIKDEEYIVSAIYRPHFKYDHIKEFMNAIQPILNDKIFSKSKTILTGDFNINLLEHHTHSDTNDYLAFMQNFFYLPIITRPTRYPEGQQRGSPSLLDHVYINFTPPSISGILKIGIADHLPVFINFLLPASKLSHYNIKFRIIKDENRRKFTRDLSLIMWEEILSSGDINVNFASFISTFQRLYNTNFPVVFKSISWKRAMHPWITPSLRNSINNKYTALNDFRMGLISWEDYKKIRHLK